MNRANTVWEAFRDTAARFPDHPCLQVLPETAAIYGIDAGERRYAAVLAEVDALAGAFRDAGYGPGLRAGLLLENRPSFLTHWFALNRLGVSVVPISAEMRAAELEYLCGHSEIALAVTLPERAGDLRAAAERAGTRLAVMSPGEAVPPAPRPPVDAALDRDSECALLYTSGTTGRPKGCVLPNRYFLGAGEWYAGIGGLAALREGGERMLTPLPVNHMNAMAFSTLAMVLTGGCLILLDRFHPRSWWESVRESRATVVHYLGVMPAMLLAAEPSQADRDHHVRFGFGAGVDRRHHAAFEERFGFPLLEAWAMTETGPGAAVIANHEPRHVGTSCFGRPEPAVEVRLVGDDGGDVPDGEPGELWVRAAGDDPAHGFFREYLKNPEATAEVWAGGWFHTGDVVRRSADGSLHFVDRKKNVIRRSGENISAVEVESVLQQHPLVHQVAVGAVADEIRGDEVIACVVPAETVSAERREAHAASIVDYCLEQLAYYKAPGYVAFVEALPLTPTQKVQRGELRALVRELPGQACCVDTRGLKKRR
ncbi:AMP-binding protein [Arhodomonas sp. KWT2]|uniref:AMP-binding protein n=2 Tax=unclassified Arhodomonas TaxID=2621637 RepID=UPI0035C1F0D7